MSRQPPPIGHYDDGRHAWTQWLDTTGGSDPQYLIVEVDVPGGKQVTLRLRPKLDRSLRIYPGPGAHVRLGRSINRDGRYQPVALETRPVWWTPQLLPQRYQLEGPGWESADVAFRAYFDARGGVDIFTKTRPTNVLDTIGIRGSYHELADWGMDILKVGQSLGAGGVALALPHPSRRGDTLYRISSHGTQTFRQLANGPLHAALSLEYDSVTFLGQALPAHRHQFLIDQRGKYYRGRLELASRSNARPAVGIVTLKPGITPIITTTPGGGQLIYTYGYQSENQDSLGMALYLPRGYPITARQAPTAGPGITNTVIAVSDQPTTTLEYYLITGWQRDGLAPATNRRAFKAYVDEVIDQIERPLAVRRIPRRPPHKPN